MPFDSDAPDPLGARLAPEKSADSHPLLEDLKLDRWSESDLLQLRAAVEAHLPVKALEDTDLSKELVLQMVALQKLQLEVTKDSEKVPANQRAQVANSLSAALSNLVKRQAEVYTTERFKLFERLLISFIDGAPDDETRQAWYQRWEETVKAATSG